MSKTTEFKIVVPTKDLSLNCSYILYQFYQEADIHEMFEFDRHKTEKFVEQMLDSPHGCVYIAVVGNKIVGIIIGLASETAFSYGLAAAEMAWWVDPEYRKTKIGPELMRHYEDWCKEIGAKVCVMSTYPKISPPSLGKFYERNGYEAGEISYRKVIN